MRRFSYFILVLFVVFSCSSNKDLITRKGSVPEEEFYSTFTEATKHALLGNYSNALNLYSLCIREFPEKSASYYQVSNIYLTVQDIPKAKSFGMKAVELDDKNKWYLLHLANIYQYESNLDSLILLYEKVVEISENPEYTYNLALFYSTRGDYDKSMKLVHELEKSLEGSREIYLIKHKNYAGMNYQDSAIASLENLIYYFPDQFENYGMLAEYLSEINKLEESRQVYMELLVREPNNGLANLSYGDFFLKQGIKDTALLYYVLGFKADDIAIEDKIGILYNYAVDPSFISSDTSFVITLIQTLKDKYDDPRPYTFAAEYYLKREDYNRASEELGKAIDFGADNYIIWEQYIMISNFLSKHEEVKGVYVEAISLFPDQINLYIFSGYSLFFLKEYESILEFEEAGLSIDQKEQDQYIQYLNLLADTYRAIDSIPKSDSLFEEILRIDPNNLLIRNNYSYYLSIRGTELDRAEEMSRLTIKREPNNSTYLDTYGWILFKMGNSKDALKYIEASIKNGAYNNAEVLDHYGDIMFDLGRCKEAVEAWNEALKYLAEEDTKIADKLDNIDKSKCSE